MAFDETRHGHESYGQISVSHISTRGETLYGSSIRHSEIIRIGICRSTLYRSLNCDRHYGHEELIEVDLSYSQFTEFVTTHNRGTGVPCTIRHINRKAMRPPPFFNKREQHATEFKDSTAKIARKMDEAIDMLSELLEKPSAKKSDLRELAERLRYARQCIASDLPFALDQFNEQMDLSTKEAKGEIEGFALRRVLLAGMNAIEREGPVSPPIPMIEGPVSQPEPT